MSKRNVCGQDWVDLFIHPTHRARVKLFLKRREYSRLVYRLDDLHEVMIRFPPCARVSDENEFLAAIEKFGVSDKVCRVITSQHSWPADPETLEPVELFRWLDSSYVTLAVLGGKGGMALLFAPEFSIPLLYIPKCNAKERT